MGRKSLPRRHLAVLTSFILLLVVPLPVLAHERWFVDDHAAYPVRPELLLSLPTLLGLALSAALVAGLWFIRWLAGGDNLFPRFGFLRRFDPSAPVVIAIQTAISLIYMAVNLRLFAPNLVLPGDLFGYLLAGVQLFVAFSFISSVFARWAALVVLGLVLLSGVLYGLVAMLEQSIFAGIAIYVALMGRGMIDPLRPGAVAQRWDRYRPLAPSILRVLAGLSIVVLAFSEKLLNPDLGVAFLREYPHFNVVRQFGFSWFTDELFVLGAGIAELAIGVTLMAGILPRLVIFAMFVPFNLTIPFLPATELIGHLPIFAVMYVLLFHQPSLRVDAPEGPTVERTVMPGADDRRIYAK